MLLTLGRGSRPEGEHSTARTRRKDEEDGPSEQVRWSGSARNDEMSDILEVAGAEDALNDQDAEVRDLE